MYLPEIDILQLMSAAAHAIVTMHYKSYAALTHKIQDAIIEEKVSINQKIATEGIEEVTEEEMEEGLEEVGVDGQGSENHKSEALGTTGRSDQLDCDVSSSRDSVDTDNQ